MVITRKKRVRGANGLLLLLFWFPCSLRHCYSFQKCRRGKAISRTQTLSSQSIAQGKNSARQAHRSLVGRKQPVLAPGPFLSLSFSYPDLSSSLELIAKSRRKEEIEATLFFAAFTTPSFFFFYTFGDSWLDIDSCGCVRGEFSCAKRIATSLTPLGGKEEGKTRQWSCSSKGRGYGSSLSPTRRLRVRLSYMAYKKEEVWEYSTVGRGPHHSH